MWWQSALWAFGGGLAIQLYYLWARNHMPEDERPDINLIYWLGFFGLPLVGAFFATAYEQSGYDSSPILAVYFGLTTPAFLRSVTRDNPFQRPVDPPQGA
jgi:hypothetical protein